MGEPVRTVVLPTQVLFARAEAQRTGSTTVVRRRPIAVRLERDRLQRALDIVSARHPILRAGLIPTETSLDPAEPEYWWRAWELRTQGGRPLLTVAPDADSTKATFDLADGVSCRLEFREPDAESHTREQGTVLTLATSHAFFDDWSLDVFWRELANAYADPDSRGRIEKPPSFLEYTDGAYHAWTHGLWRGHNETLARQFQDFVPCSVPRDKKLTIWPISKGIVFDLDEEGEVGFERAVQVTGRGSFTVAVALFLGALRAVMGWSDVAVVLVAANRRSATHDAIGLFVNFVAARYRIADHPVLDMAANVWSSNVAALAHSVVPFPIVQAEVPAVRDALSSQPLVAIRQPYARPQTARSRTSGFAVADDEPATPSAVSVPRNFASSSDPAQYYGIGDAALLFDCISDTKTPHFRLSYRADIVHPDLAGMIVAAVRHEAVLLRGA